MGEEEQGAVVETGQEDDDEGHSLLFGLWSKAVVELGHRRRCQNMQDWQRVEPDHRTAAAVVQSRRQGDPCRAVAAVDLRP